MSFEHKPDLAGDAQRRVIAQYRENDQFMALIGALGDEVQQIEDAIYALYQAAFLDTATDVWLEYLGAIVGEAREGWGDADYLRFIRARILANKSSGTIDELLEIVAMVLGSPVGVMWDTIQEFYPASLLLVVDVGLNPSEALRNRMTRITARARPAGVRLMINTAPEDHGTFACGDSGNAQPELDSAQGFGDSSDPSTGGKLASGDLA